MDALTMCPNIDTEEGLVALCTCYEMNLTKHTKNLSIKKLMCALRLLMKLNVFLFSSTCCRQIYGATIGVLPAID